MSILTDYNFDVNTIKNFKYEACPVCNQKDSRCRPSYEESIVCWNSTMQDIDEKTWYVIADINSSRSGMRGLMVALKRGAEYTEADQELLEVNRERARKKRSLELAKLPSAETRDQGYREILGAMTLGNEHKEKLKRRGLTEKQIELAEKLYWFKTWQVGIKSSENLAGIDPGTGETRWLGGMLISALYGNGRILGGQIAADKPGIVGKYFWLSSLKVGGYGCQMQHTNALPLFVRKHPDSTKTSQIWLCEGGLKSAITALKAWQTDKNIVVVGTAMSARFSDQLIDILVDLIPSDGVKVMPDAGTLENPAILTSVLMTLEQVKSIGLVPLIGWWQQWSKDGICPDIDDYLTETSGDYSSIEWLTTSQFMSLSPIPPTKLTEESEKKVEDKIDKKTEERVRDYSVHPAYKGYKTYSEMELPDEKKYGNLLTNQRNLATVWNKRNDDVIEQQIGWEFYPPRPDEILFIKAGTGRGKSHLVSYWMNEFYIEKGCIFLGYRNGLLYQQCDKVKNLEHLRDKDGDGFLRMLDPYYRVAFCDASLHNMKSGYASDKILVIDEVMSVIESLYLSSTCSDKRRSRIETFEKMLREAEIVICLDAHMAEWCVQLLTSLSQKQARKMQNNWEGEPRQVKVLMGTETNPNDKKKIRREIVESAMDDRAIAVFSDSQHELESLHELMLKQGILDQKIVRIDSKTSGFAWCQEMLRNIDKYLAEHPEIKILLVSPSGDSGLDISRVYFEQVFLILVGTLTIDSALQMYGRVRDNAVPRMVFCAKDALFKLEGGLTRAEVGAEIKMSIESQLVLICEGEDKTESEELNKLVTEAVAKWQNIESRDLHSKAVNIMIARANFEKVYYRDLFIARLVERGDNIELIYDDGEKNEIDGKFKEASNDVKYAAAAKLVAAEDINEIQAEALRRKDLNPDQAVVLQKFEFKRRMPGIEIDEDLAKTLLYDRSFMKGLEQRFYLSYPIVSRNMAKTKWSSALAKRELFTSDLRSRIFLKTECLNQLGIVEYLDDRIWLENGTEVKTLRKRWDDLRKTHGDRLPGIMGFDWDKKHPSKTVHRLLDLVGCDWRVIKKKSGEDKNSAKQRKITFGSLNDPTRLAILESFEVRFQELKTMEWSGELRRAATNELNLEVELGSEARTEKVMV